MYLLSYDLLKTSKTSRNDCALREMKRRLVFRDKTFRVLTAVCCSGAISWIRFGQVEVTLDVHSALKPLEATRSSEWNMMYRDWDEAVTGFGRVLPQYFPAKKQRIVS